MRVFTGLKGTLGPFKFQGSKSATFRISCRGLGLSNFSRTFVMQMCGLVHLKKKRRCLKASKVTSGPWTLESTSIDYASDICTRSTLPQLPQKHRTPGPYAAVLLASCESPCCSVRTASHLHSKQLTEKTHSWSSFKKVQQTKTHHIPKKSIPSAFADQLQIPSKISFL